MKSPNNIKFPYVSKYMERLLNKLSKLWSGGLYAPAISHFLRGLFLEKEFHYHLCVNLVVW